MICSRCDDPIPRHLQRFECAILWFCCRLKFACEQVFHDTILIGSADVTRTYMMKATVSVPCVTGIARRACNRFDAANIVNGAAAPDGRLSVEGPAPARAAITGEKPPKTIIGGAGENDEAAN
jgi:hypothetical protein